MADESKSPNSGGPHPDTGAESTDPGAVKVIQDRVKGMDHADRLLLFGSVGVFLLGFLHWYAIKTPFASMSYQGYSGGVGWLFGVTSLSTTALLLVPSLRESLFGGLTRRNTKQILFGLAVATLVFGPLRMLFSSPVEGMPDMSGMQGEMAEMFSVGRTLWFWLACIAGGVAVYGGYQALSGESQAD